MIFWKSATFVAFEVRWGRRALGAGGREFSVLSLALVVAGCSGRIQPGIDSGLPKDKQVAALSEAEGDVFCDATLRYLDDVFGLVELSCSQQGFQAGAAGKTNSEVIMLCKDAYEPCVASLTFEDARLALAPSISCYEQFPPPASCNATVADVEGCFSDLLEAGAAQHRGCDELTVLDYPPTPQLTQPENCRAVAINCPEIF